jgi:hypothetical protein
MLAAINESDNMIQIPCVPGQYLAAR